MGVDNDAMVDTNDSTNSSHNPTTALIITNKEDVVNVKTDPSLYYKPPNSLMSISEGPRSPLVEKPVFVSKGSEMQVDIKPDANYVNSRHYINPQAPTIKDYKITETATNKDQEYTSRTEDLGGKEESPESSNFNNVDVGDEWNTDQAWRTRFLRTIMDEKKQRQQERVLINKEKELIAYERRNLELEKKQIDYDRRDVEDKLQEINKYRDILPSAKQLREMGVDFYDIVIWIELIKDRAATEGITPKEAVTKIVEDLKLYTQFTTLEQAIKHAQQNLEALNIVIELRRQAIASLVDLKNRGISDTDLVELNNLIHSWGGERNNGSSQERALTGNGVNGINMLVGRLDDKLNLAQGC